MAAAHGPKYLRLLRGNVPTVLDEYNYTFVLGKAAELRTGRDVSFISTGLMTMRALQAAEGWQADGVDVAVTHVPTIKPLDHEAIARAAAGGRPGGDLGEPHGGRRPGRRGGLLAWFTAASPCVPAGGSSGSALPDEFLGRRAAHAARSVRPVHRPDRPIRPWLALTTSNSAKPEKT